MFVCVCVRQRQGEERVFVCVCETERVRGLTTGVLLADVSHDLHEAVADALFIRLLLDCDARPVGFLIVPLLPQRVPALHAHTHTHS